MANIKETLREKKLKEIINLLKKHKLINIKKTTNGWSFKQGFKRKGYVEDIAVIYRIKEET